ncbi:MAG: hypothetical protein AB8B71_16340 [Paracoccaceae bacterium]
MGKFLCRLLSVAVLIGAFVNFGVVFATSPAFNNDERLESVAGGWRVPNAAAHYDKAEYLLELGYTYLNELSVTYDPDTGDVAIIGIEELEAQTEKALDLLGQSLRLDPANASGWTYLAQAQGRSNDIDAMRGSLERSWALAPNNMQLAPLRLQLVIQIYETNLHTPDQVAALSDQEIASARGDGRVLNVQSPDELEILMPGNDPLRALLGDLKDLRS